MVRNNDNPCVFFHSAEVKLAPLKIQWKLGGVDDCLGLGGWFPYTLLVVQGDLQMAQLESSGKCRILQEYM